MVPDVSGKKSRCTDPTSWEQITDDIDDARIYGGIHFRYDQEAGAHQGRHVGKYIRRHSLRSVHDDDDFGRAR